MMRLTAQFADMWNTAYLHQPASLGEPLAKMHQACGEVGRDPSTLGVTVLVSLAYPELGERSKITGDYLRS